MPRILLTGASGFVGRALGEALASRGDSVIAVSRSSRHKLPFAAETVSWNKLQDLRDIDAIVHLAGETVAQRWTVSAKKKIVKSRVDTARQLHAALGKIQGRKPQVYVSASAVGYYGDRGDALLDEQSAPGRDFLAETCVAWEKSAQEFSANMPRVVILRFGMVYGAGGGALVRMIPIFKMGLGGRLGSGEQWLSWIHLDDLVLLLMRSIDQNQMNGIYNAVAPEPVRNRLFTEDLAEVLCRRARFPVPAFVLQMVLGEMASMLLSSQRVSSRLSGEDFHFKYPRNFEALRDSVRG